jgi:hypothetical protein
MSKTKIYLLVGTSYFQPRNIYKVYAAFSDISQARQECAKKNNNARDFVYWLETRNVVHAPEVNMEK